jgi:hypothetical protein
VLLRHGATLVCSGEEDEVVSASGARWSVPSQGRDRSRARAGRRLRNWRRREPGYPLARALEAWGSRNKAPRRPSLSTARLATLPIAGGGGVGGWLTSVASHRLSTAALVSVTVIICVALLIHGLPKIMKRFYEHREAIIRAGHEGRNSRIGEEATNQMLLEGVKDSDHTARAQKLVMAHALVEFPKGRKLTDKDVEYGRLLAAYGEAASATKDEPDDGQVASCGTPDDAAPPAESSAAAADGPVSIGTLPECQACVILLRNAGGPARRPQRNR